MERAFHLVAVLGACAAIVACSGESGSEFEQNKQPDDPAAQAPTSPIVPPESTTPATPAAAQCSAVIPDGFKPSWLAPARQKVCSPDDLKGYYNACLADPSKKDQCAAWTKDHGTCTACIEPTSKSGPVQWHDSSTTQRLFFTLNVAGCIALQQDKLADTDCGAAYNAAVQCGRQSCTKCLETGGSYPEFRSCQSSVQQDGICKSYEAVMQQTCQGIKNAGQATLECFQTSTETQLDHFVRVEGFFCGQ